MQEKKTTSQDSQNNYLNSNIPSFKLLFNLMLNPSVFMILQNRNVVKTLTQVLGFTIIACFLLTLNVIISFNKSSKHWEQWLKTEIQEFGITKEKTFFWKHPEEIPYMTQIDGWQINISDCNNNLF